MKRKSTLIITLLLIATLALGVGYAALSRDLVIEGVAKNSPTPLNVVFTDISVKDAKTDAIRNATTENLGTPGDFTIGFTAANLSKVNDYVTVTFEITNKNEYAVTLEDPTISGNAKFDVTTAWGAEGVELGANETTTLDVTVKLLVPTAEIISEQFQIKIKANSAE